MKRLILFVLCCWVPWSYAQDIDAVTTSFEQRLNQAKARHQQVSEQLLNQHRPVVKQLQQLEAELIHLRQQVAGATRAQDEQFVSLQSLQERLTQWQQQTRYIDNLLNRYLNDTGAASNTAFSQRLAALTQATRPQWQVGTAVASNGHLIQGKQLILGPLAWFKDQQGNGFVGQQGADGLALIMSVDLTNAEPHQLPVDVTQDKATRIAANDVGWLAKVKRGGVWIYPIVAIGALALLVALVKLIGLLRLTPLNRQLAEQWALGEQVALNAGWQQQLINLAQQYGDWPQEALADKLHHQLLIWKGQLESKMVVLASAAAVAPLLGLLGTVSGMIHTFEMMNLFGNNDQSLLAGGISEALITTELGLVVAVPTLLAHAFIHRRHHTYLAQLEADSVLLLEQVRPQGMA